MPSAAAPIIALSPWPADGHQIVTSLREAGLDHVAAVRTCDEALFLLGRKNPILLILDEAVAPHDEQRLLRHFALCGHAAPPGIIRLVDRDSSNQLAIGRALAAGVIRKPLKPQDVVINVGTVLRRPNLIAMTDHEAAVSSREMTTARRMQLALLPREQDLVALRDACGVGIAGSWRPGAAVGGDFWGVWQTGQTSFALTLADFAGHGLGAALNTFRLHAILTEETLPRSEPAQMAHLLSHRLHGLLERGEYATMVYARIDPERRGVAWCGAGGPSPLFVGASGQEWDLELNGLPLGVSPDYVYRESAIELPEPGVLCLFSDGLYEGGGGTADIARTMIAAAVTDAAAMTLTATASDAARSALSALEALRDSLVCHDHSDDVMAVCVAFGSEQVQNRFRA